MRLNLPQSIVVVGSALLVVLLFFGFETIPPEQRLVEKSRALSFEPADLTNAINAAKQSLDAEEASYFRTLENIVTNAQTDSQRVVALKKLSGAWFDREDYIPAGYYAERVAEIENTEESWSVAGSTYAYALTTSTDISRELKDIARKKAVQAYQNALSINPQNVAHRVNIAICYTEHPPAQNPMKGIQDLLALSEEYPQNTAVLYHLARFGMRTGQFDKAIGRLQTALEIDPGEARVHCLLAQAYAETGRDDKAARHAELCQTE